MHAHSSNLGIEVATALWKAFKILDNDNNSYQQPGEKENDIIPGCRFVQELRFRSFNSGHFTYKACNI
jgi:hypothetical protein